MLRYVAKIPVCFQSLPTVVGGSVQHGCNMIALGQCGLLLLTRALSERQQIVGPDAVGVRAQVGRVPRGAYNSDVRPLAGVGIDHEEGVGVGLDACDNLLP